MDGDTIYGFVHEMKTENDDPTDWVASCKLIDQDNFKYIITSLKKGKVIARRIRTGQELDQLLAAQAKTVKGFAELAELGVK